MTASMGERFRIYIETETTAKNHASGRHLPEFASIHPHSPRTLRGSVVAAVSARER
jgi:hypothetical protein